MTDTKFADTSEAKLHFLDYWRIIRIRKAVIFTVFLLSVITTAVVTFVFLKPVYSSTVRISVQKEVTDVEGMGNTQTYTPFDPFWLQTEFEKIQSSSVLYKVIEKLDLQKRWTQKYSPDRPLTLQETYQILLGQVRVSQSRNTSIIEITAFSEDGPAEAAEIANAVAETYKESRWAQRQELKKGGIKQLEERLREKEKAVAEQKKIVDELRRTNEIVELGDNTPSGPSYTIDKETMRQIEQLRITAEANYVEINTLYEKITQLSPEELKEVLPTAMPFPDQQLVVLLQDLATTRQKLTALLQDFSKEHPEAKRAQAVVDLLEAQINDRVKGIVDGLATKVAQAKARRDQLTEAVEKAKIEQTDLAAKYRPYFDAKLRLDELERVKQILSLKIEEESVEASLPVSTAVEIVHPAEPEPRPVKPRKGLSIAASAVVGLIIGICLAFFIEYLDTSVKTIDDIERALQAPVLGVIPQNVGALVEEGPESPHAEAYRVLRTNILFGRKDENLNTITVVSGGVGEGKSTTLMNLATIFAQNGDRVLVVDSDLRRPSLHKILKVSNSVGLTNYLLKQNSLEEVIQTTSQPFLDFLPSGKLPSSSMGILNSEQMKLLILELKRRYDFVFFDSPPIMGVSDASILSREMDLTLQVIQYRRYPQPMTIRAKQLIQKVGGNLIGIVLNNINMSQDESYYYYSGYYQDYYKPSAQDGDSEDKPGKTKNSVGEQAKLELKRKY